MDKYVENKNGLIKKILSINIRPEVTSEILAAVFYLHRYTHRTSLRVPADNFIQFVHLPVTNE